MNVCMLLGHDFFEPIMDPRVYKESQALVEAGHDVTILCWAKRLEGLPSESVCDGIVVRRVFQKVYSEKTNLLFKIPQFEQLRSKMVIEMEKIRPDIIHCHDLEMLPIGSRMKQKYPNIKLIYDSQDDWPAMELESSNVVAWITERIEEKHIAFVDYVITWTDTLAEKFGQVKPTSVILNTPSSNWGDELDPAPIVEKYDLADKIVVVNKGIIAARKGLLMLLNAAGQLVRKYPEVRFLNVGPVDELDQYQQVIEQKGLQSHVFFTGAVDHNNIPRYLKAGHIGYAVVQPSPIDKQMPHSQVFEYMTLSLPVVYGSENIEMARIIDNAEAGLTVPYQLDEIVEALSRLITTPALRERLGASGRTALVEQYAWQTQKEVLLAIYEALMKSAMVC